MYLQKQMQNSGQSSCEAARTHVLTHAWVCCLHGLQAAAAAGASTIYIPPVREIADYDTTNRAAMADVPRYSQLDPATAAYFRYQVCGVLLMMIQSQQPQRMTAAMLC